MKKQPRAESTSDLSHVMLNVEHWHSAIGLTIHNMNDLADVLVEYNRRLQPMFRLRAGSPEEQLARTLGDGS